ncbi:MAG TPA: aromatic-ring-hydroxylating dioxygenase subunit beta [Nocardioidaceae bacterium]|nr:aromatic-ring-hydroxylating dioxygenase subunit beta [Nocardioidaceae bacterium]
MTVTTDIDIRTIERFVYEEARYADDHDYDAWESLWTDDAIYWVPVDGEGTDPLRTMSIIFDNRNRISTRLNQLRTGKRYSQAPRSTLRRIVSNVEVLGSEGDDIVVGANFILLEARETKNETLGGRYTYRLRPDGDGFKLAYKKVVLVGNDKPLPSMGFII